MTSERPRRPRRAGSPIRVRRHITASPAARSTRTACRSTCTWNPGDPGRTSSSTAGSRAGKGSPTAGSSARSSTRSWPGPSWPRTTGASPPGSPSRSSKPIPIGQRHPRRRLGHPVPTSARRDGRADRRRRDGPRARDRRGTYVAADAERKQELRERYGFRSSTRTSRSRDRYARHGGFAPMTPTASARPRDRQRGDRPRRRLRGGPQARGGGPRCRPRRADQRSGRVRRCPDRRPRSASPTPSTSRASSASRRGSAPVHGVRSPLIGGRLARLPQRDPEGTRRRRCCSSPTACSTSRPRTALVRVRPARADAADRDRTNVAAPSPRRARGRRLDHRGLPRPPVRQGHPRRAVSLGRAGAAGLLAIALGAPAGRLDHRDDDPRRPAPRPRPRAGPTRAPVARPAHGRRRAGRPEGAVVGLSLARAGRPGRDHRRPPAETDRAAATDDGHRAWVIRDSLCKLDPPSRTSSAPASQASASDRAPRPPRSPPRPRLVSASCPTRPPTPSLRSHDRPRSSAP